MAGKEERCTTPPQHWLHASKLRSKRMNPFVRRDGAAAATESVSNPTFDDGGLDGGAGTPDLIGDRKTLLPRLFQLSHRYRARQFITADCLRHAIAGDRVEDLEFPFWRNCCGRGWDLVKCRPIKYAKGRKLKSWSWFRYSEELWNLLTYKLV